MLLSGIVPDGGMFISGSSVTRSSGHLPGAKALTLLLERVPRPPAIASD